MKEKLITRFAKQEKGITLVALVVTIVVLLILAGITIMYVFGDNSVFKKASEAKVKTEIGKIEERAQMIYSDKLLEKISNNIKDKPTMQEIVEELRKEKYTIEQVAITGNKITGISLEKESMSLGKEQTKMLTVILESDGSPYIYYVLLENKYYQMHFNDGYITIDRVPSEIEGEEDNEKITLIATSENETIATVVVDNDTNSINITAKNKTGIVTITVTYGNYIKTCSVRVCELATDLEINSVRARIAKDYTRWLTAVAKSEETASQEFEWSSSDTSIATVDNKGHITAKEVGTATITVKTTDGSELSRTCEITIVDGVDVATLTEYQIENIVAKDINGNLIIIPGDFKVVTSKGTKVTEGIVIQDKEGNEFVWVPIDSVSSRNYKTSR